MAVTRQMEMEGEHARLPDQILCPHTPNPAPCAAAGAGRQAHEGSGLRVVGDDPETTFMSHEKRRGAWACAVLAALAASGLPAWTPSVAPPEEAGTDQGRAREASVAVGAASASMSAQAQTAGPAEAGSGPCRPVLAECFCPVTPGRAAPLSARRRCFQTFKQWPAHRRAFIREAGSLEV